MTAKFTEHDLEAYLDESLPANEMAQIEDSLRSDADLVKRLAALNNRRSAGVHTLGEIWRRHRISCPSREQLGGFLLQTLDDLQADYIRFHLKQGGCRLCQANLDDLQSEQQTQQADVVSRRRKYFQSSAGYLEED